MKQKAYCRDFERLTNAEADLGTAIRTIPEIVTILAPATGEPGDGLTPLNVPGIWFTGHFARLAKVDPEDPESPMVEKMFLQTVGDDGSDGLGSLFFVQHTLTGESIKTVTDHDPEWTTLSVPHVAWRNLAAELERVRQLVLVFNDWISLTFNEGEAGHEAARAALVEVLKRLEALESAFAETMKKWREH